MALGGALVGGWLGARLAGDKLPSLRYAGVLGAAVIFALTGYGLLSTGESDVRAAVALGPDGMVVRVDPPDDTLLADRHRLAGRRTGRRPAATYRPGRVPLDEPIPTTGEWKTMIRLHAGNALTALPVYLPADPAIPVEGVPAEPASSGPSGTSRSCSSASARAPPAGSGARPTASCWRSTLGFLAALAWGVHRVASPPPEPNPPRFERSRAPEPAIR